MDYFYIVLILVVIVLCGVVWYFIKKKNESEREVELAEKERDEYEELGKGLADYNQKLQEKKDKVKAKILELVKAGPKISNHDVAEKLGILRSSIKRYLDELEVENKITQVGKSGRSVFYTAK